MKQATVLLLVLVSVIGMSYGSIITSRRCTVTHGCGSSMCCVYPHKYRVSTYGYCRSFGGLGDFCFTRYVSLVRNPGGFFHYSPCRSPFVCAADGYGTGTGTCQQRGGYY